MRKSGNRCYKCEYFIQHYKKSLYNFYPDGFGFCNKTCVAVCEDGVCENFSKQLRKPLTVNEVDCAIDAVKDFSKILIRLILLEY